VVERAIVCLRADGNPAIGLGHVHRLIALSQILKGLFQIKFLITDPLPGVADLVRRNCDELVEIACGTNIENEIELVIHHAGKNNLVVLDGYHFDIHYQKSIATHGNPLVVIDDLIAPGIPADVIINMAGGISADNYRDTTARIFCGPRYALLKQDFLSLASARPTPSAVDNLLVCLGGADPDNHTMKLVDAIDRESFNTIIVVVGEGYLFIDELHQRVKVSGGRIEIVQNAVSEKMAELMSQCNTAILSASGIAYEYCCAKGVAYLVQTASNQQLFYNYLVGEGYAFPVERLGKVTKAERDRALEKQAITFDGKSGRRILKIFHELDFENNLAIRDVHENDMLIIHQWANDPLTRSLSFNTDPIPLEGHVHWFKKKIKDPSVCYLIFEYRGIPLGQVRFEVTEQGAVVSYLLSPVFRGRGFGQLMLTKALDHFKISGRQHMIIGYVKKENEASRRIFKNLGFGEFETAEYDNALVFKLNLNEN
jgi:UDP-2,4-diacetamido-2,4,6-trideoxy-beta-L-altropyranose hydrolase